ncbi:atesin-3 [Amanita rubescens]|nr:atesin-3 [Amanita rubescens]
MQFRAQLFVVQLLAAALLLSSGVRASPADPQLIARGPELSCQACDIWGAGDACCSASCIAHGQGIHGGYCDSHKVCHCTV